MGYTVAVVGATGNVGRELISILAEREFPVDEVIGLASHRSVGDEISFGEDEIVTVKNLDGFDFKGVDIVLAKSCIIGTLIFGIVESNPSISRYNSSPLCSISDMAYPGLPFDNAT